MEYVAGRTPALECLRARRRQVHQIYLLRDAKGLEAVREAAGNLPVKLCSRVELDAMLPDALHQGVILKVSPLGVQPADSWVRQTFDEGTVLVMLDCVEDPHNFGAIVRSASACGARAVIFAKDRSAPISPAAVKSAAGAMEHIELVQATNLVRCIEDLKKAGFWVAGFEADAPQTLWDADLKGRILLVIGSEGKGMRRLVEEHCDFRLRIPLTGPITSLNASVSAAVALVECMRQRATNAPKAKQ